jgi:hypothetical protein
MAIQILPQEYDLGSSLGTGLSQTLQGLANTKMQQLQQRNLLNSLVQGGINPQHAQILSQLSPQERTAYFQRLGPSDTGEQQGQPDILGSLEQELSQPQVQQPRLPALSGQEALMRAVQDYQQRQVPQSQTQQAQPVDSRTQAARRAPSFGEVLSRPSPSEERQERRHQQTLSQADRHFIHKNIQPFIDKILDEDRAKVQEDAILKRIINVREKGTVRSALLTNVMRQAGIDFQALKNGDTLEIEKLGKFFLRGGPAMFGGKVSNFEAQNLLSQVPNELQTDEGAIRLANQMLNLNKAVHEENRIIKDIVRENGGHPPLDLKMKVAERMEPINERLARDFIPPRAAQKD